MPDLRTKGGQVKRHKIYHSVGFPHTLQKIGRENKPSVFSTINCWYSLKQSWDLIKDFLGLASPFVFEKICQQLAAGRRINARRDLNAVIQFGMLHQIHD